MADGCREKLIRRHPHVFGGDRQADTAGEVVRNWNEIKRQDERGGAVFGDLPENLPATLYARKIQKRSESAGLRGGRHAGEALADVGRSCESFFSTGWDSDAQGFEEIGRLLFAAVEAAGALGVDPEVALRREAERYRAEIEEGELT